MGRDRERAAPARALWLAALACLLLGSCASTPRRGRAPDYRTVDTHTGRELSLEQLADRLAEHDVVFLGEIHTSARGHWLQTELTRLLADRRGGLLLSLEMFERDTQVALNEYLAGRRSEAEFLAEARPWADYDAFYRPAIAWARRTGRAVFAANIPRSIARAVSREGRPAVEAGDGAVWLPRAWDTSPGEYRDRFLAAVGAHGNLTPAQAEQWYAAQCLKDDVMAETIADALERFAEAAPIAVHWCGRFHSDFGLGTVERLRTRRPDLSIAIVSMVEGDSTRELVGDDLRRADYVWLVD